MTNPITHRRPLRSALFNKTLAVAALALCAQSSKAQVFDAAGLTNVRGFHQASGDRNMARHGSYLFIAVVQQNGTVQIRRKADDTVSVWTTYGPPVNNVLTGAGSSNRTTNVSMAVSRTGHLHVTWGRFYYPYFFRQYYRCFNIASSTYTHATQDITALVGATSTTRSDSMAIAVGGKDKVYLSAQNGTQSWRSRLLQSTFVSFPTGAAPAWTNRGPIPSNSASSQNVSMTVDLGGLVHMSYYNSVGTGRYATRIFRPDTLTWTTQDFIGIPPSPRDNDGYIMGGLDSYTHVLYRHVAGVVGGVTRYQLLYRRRNGTGAWSAPIIVYEFDSTMSGSNTSYGTFALAAGRQVYAIYRDYCSGRLMVKQKKITGSGFKFIAELRPNSSALNDYILPSVRSTVWPQGNRIYRFLDVSFRRPTGATYRLFHQRLEVSEMNVDFTGCTGTAGEPQITFGGVPASPAPRTVEIGVNNAAPGAMAIMLWDLSPTTAIPFGCGTLYASSLWFPILTTNSCGNAKHVVPLPPGGYSTWFYFQWAVNDSGWKLSNRGRLRL